MEPIGVTVLFSKENTIILSRNLNFAQIVSKLGKKSRSSIEINKCQKDTM